MLRQPDEPSQVKTPKRTRKPAKKQEHEQEQVLGQEERQAEVPTTQSSHNDPVVFVANF
ncbi:hypothetical protein PPTG_07562 [Phytophthora nicotianae INRA-310]|uniref:Uncharacterized protein n=1 Tax=Phytophthora nicotianae (strain INRA-310) TaxID=761204 RepID=W2QN11_PHYN3|nr:hypothetical protein PPTG_07562 [Phytophthora nicotianae INRA-310]ETN14523.1 hypothetical protein PPTG_07562 [Phytophthora nicotianae INRA-310]